MRPYVQKIAAGAREDYPVKGDYIRLKTASVPVTFEGRDSGFKVTLEQGDSVRLKEFQAVIVSHGDAAEQTVTFYVGNGESLDSSQVGGSVQISNVNGSFTQPQASVTNAVSTLLAANAARRYLLIQNNDASAVLRVTVDGSAPSATKGFRIAAGDSLEIHSYSPTGAIKGFMETATGTANNVEIAEG